MSVHEKNRSKHDRLVSQLEERLNHNENYQNICTNYWYETKRYAGELDVFLYNQRSGNYHYYEVKCNYNHKTWKKAKQQVERLRKAFPSYRIRGIFYSPEYVGRL